MKQLFQVIIIGITSLISVKTVSYLSFSAWSWATPFEIVVGPALIALLLPKAHWWRAGTMWLIACSSISVAVVVLKNFYVFSGRISGEFFSREDWQQIAIAFALGIAALGVRRRGGVVESEK